MARSDDGERAAASSRKLLNSELLPVAPPRRFGKHRTMRRSIIFLLAAGVFAVAAPAARAKSTCSVPDEPAWHSCLTARHATLSTGSVRLTRATPALVVRLQHGCPDRLAKRRVVLRTKAGTRIAAEKVTG